VRHKLRGQRGDHAGRLLLAAVQSVDHLCQPWVGPRDGCDASGHNLGILEAIRPSLVVAEQVGDPGLQLPLVAHQMRQHLQRVPLSRCGPVRGLNVAHVRQDGCQLGAGLGIGPAHSLGQPGRRWWDCRNMPPREDHFCGVAFAAAIECYFHAVAGTMGGQRRDETRVVDCRPPREGNDHIVALQAGLLGPQAGDHAGQAHTLADRHAQAGRDACVELIQVDTEEGATHIAQVLPGLQY